MQTETLKKLFTVLDYHRMAETGILGPADRTELIEGEILQMSPIGHRHSMSVSRGIHCFTEALRGRVIVNPQNPLVLDDYSEPQPDIVLARPRDDYYAGRRISPEDTFLVLEVSDTTLRYDHNRKTPLYAKSGVPEVWIENLQSDVIRVYRNPGPEAYSTSLTFRRGESLSMDAFPDDVFKVEELLG